MMEKLKFSSHRRPLSTIENTSAVNSVDFTSDYFPNNSSDEVDISPQTSQGQCTASNASPDDEREYINARRNSKPLKTNLAQGRVLSRRTASERRRVAIRWRRNAATQRPGEPRRIAEAEGETRRVNPVLVQRLQEAGGGYCWFVGGCCQCALFGCACLWCILFICVLSRVIYLFV